MVKENSIASDLMSRKPSSRFLLVSLFCAIMLFGFGCSGVKQPLIELKPGTPAPDFTTSGVRGGIYTLKDLHGQAVLLSFINTQADATSATPDSSRAQIVFLKSMYQQYGPKGLAVFIVDATQLQTGKQPGQDELINFTYSWQLDSIPVLIDKDGKISTQFGISTVPTTLLIGTDGIIQQRWDNKASSSQLALAIEAIVGAPFYRATSVNATPTTATKSCPGETAAQAKFSGVGLARSFSNEIWAVDRGEAWAAGGNNPLQWIILDTSGKAGESKLHLQVTARYFNSESFVLIDQALELLPDDEARGLLGGQSDSLPKTYFLTTTMTLDRPGCLQVQAVITDEGTGSNLYNGEIFVTVK